MRPRWLRPRGCAARPTRPTRMWSPTQRECLHLTPCTFAEGLHLRALPCILLLWQRLRSGAAMHAAVLAADDKLHQKAGQATKSAQLYTV